MTNSSKTDSSRTASRSSNASSAMTGSRNNNARSSNEMNKWISNVGKWNAGTIGTINNGVRSGTTGSGRNGTTDKRMKIGAMNKK